jgi:DNA-binding response OmpR family regulator
MEQPLILLVEDEQDIRKIVAHNLKKEKFRVLESDSCEDALRFLEDGPQLIILDWMLPGIQGIDFIRLIRDHHKCKQTKIIMLSARAEETDMVLGADDYVTKPFSIKVLLARVRAALRNPEHQIATKSSNPAMLQWGAFRIDQESYMAWREDEKLDLTISEFKAFFHLLRNPGKVFSRPQLVQAVHGDGYMVTDRSIDVLIVSLRKKLGSEGACIKTIRGVGYCIREE